MKADLDVAHLLYEACTKGGFCLPESEQQRLIDDPPHDVDAFTDAIVRAEGLDPLTIDTGVYRGLRELVERHFSTAG